MCPCSLGFDSVVFRDRQSDASDQHSLLPFRRLSLRLAVGCLSSRAAIEAVGEGL